MGHVFSSAEEAEKNLLEILCKDNGITLGEHAFFYQPIKYGLSYTEGNYVLEIPMFGYSLNEEEQAEHDRRMSNSKLKTFLAKWLYFIAVKNPSRLNKLFMVRRAHGKRDGTKVVRECQRKLLEALKQAEESLA